jgi:hypothetical protein
MEANLKNTGNLWNIGVKDPPPNMVSTDPDMMKRALPEFSHLRVDRSGVERVTAECREYKGIGGLRELRGIQANKTYYEPKCGWLYKDGDNKGYFGSYDGTPADARTDQISGANSWMTMNLTQAELKASSNIATKAGQGCSRLGTIRPEDRTYFGYCKSSGNIIPIVSCNAISYPRYPDMPNWACSSSDIVTDVNNCPSGSGFRNYAAEGFDNGGNLIEQQTCSIPLTRDCLIQTVKDAGCTDRGAILGALSDSKISPPYKKLQENSAYSYYMNHASMPDKLIKEGKGVNNLQHAYDTFYALSDATNDTTKSVGMAARDLCLESGFFQEKYDICSEVRDNDIISIRNIDCIQKLWGLKGGTTKGSGYPTTANWGGKTVNAFKKYIDSLVSQGFENPDSIYSIDRNKQANATKELTGLDTSYIPPTRILDKVQNNQGTETVWFLNYPNNPIILRADRIMIADSSIEQIPSMLNYDDFGKLRLLPFFTDLAFTSAFEYRPETNTTVSFNTEMNGGIMIGYNQNPLEQKNNKDSGSWRDNTGNTSYTSSTYNIDTAKINTFVIKHFGTSGKIDKFKISLKEGNSSFIPFGTQNQRNNIYLTQEPLAPWLQYEVCSRKNVGNNGATLGFFEKRWNGPISINSPSSFDVISNRIAPQTNPGANTPGNKPFMRFNSSSTWRTKAGILPSSVKTITLMIKPSAQIDRRTIVMFHSLGFQLFIEKDDNGTYTFFGGSKSSVRAPCVIGEWNFLVIQYMNSSSGFIHEGSLNAGTYSQVSKNRGMFLKELTDSRNRFSQNNTDTFNKELEYINAPSIKKDLMSNTFNNSGLFSITIGGSDIIKGGLQGTKSFEGDLLWLHGFRQHFTTEYELESEVNQLWASRWPTAPATDPYLPRTQTVKGNNGAVTCQRYCEGVSGKSWNGELPDDWNGAKCKGTTHPAYNCDGLLKDSECGTWGKPSNDKNIRIYSKEECENKLNGIYYPNGECLKKGGGSHSWNCRYLNNPLECICEETRTGWNPDNPFAFQSPSLPVELSDQRSSRTTAFQPNYAINNKDAYVAQQPPTLIASSIFNLFKW